MKREGEKSLCGEDTKDSKRATKRERVKEMHILGNQNWGRQAGRFSKGSLSLVLAVRLRQRQQHWGQANTDRTSTAALTASFTGTLIGPLMFLEKVVKALEMESVPLCWHAIILLCTLCLFMNHTLLSLPPLARVLLKGALFCCKFSFFLHLFPSFTLSLHPSVPPSLSPSLSFIQHVAPLLVCIVALLQRPLFLLSTVTDFLFKMTANEARCVLVSVCKSE